MNNNDNNHGGVGNGFLWGLIVGGAVVFLLGTKKGKKLLKSITEEGLEGIGDIADLIGDDAESYEEEEEEGIVPPQAPVIVKEQNHHTNGELKSKESPMTKLSTTTKRFFKGVPKKK